VRFWELVSAIATMAMFAWMGMRLRSLLNRER
jgi:hypothetical protein